MIKSLKTAAVSAVLALGMAGTAVAQELTFFTIGTGGTAYTYYPIGGVIANAISKPPGSRECDDGGSCGVEGLIASAVSSRGSVDNINAIISGLRDSGFAQSDVAYWAYTGTGTMEGSAPATDLRTIAALFDEHIHLVAMADSGINSVADLAGKRVSLDEPGSGTYVDALLIMEANGLTVDDLTPEALKGGEKYGFCSSSDIPEGTYEGVAGVDTVAVGAQWFTSATADDELIYNITKALWNEQSRELLDVGHAKGQAITLETALSGVGVPLHAGAERFYREAGILK